MKFLKSIGKRMMSKMRSSAIVIFHHVTDNPEIKCSNCMLSEQQFFEFIESYECFDTLSNVIKKPWNKKIAITFDDGIEDLYTVAYPVLKQKKIPFTAYIVTEFIGKPGYMSYEQVKSLADDPLVEIGSHGISHATLVSLNREQKEYEISESQRRLGKLLNKDISGFAFPHGLYDVETLEILKYYKYAVAVCNQPINLITRMRKYRLPRFNIDSSSYANIYNELSFLKRK